MGYRTIGVPVEKVPEFVCLVCGTTALPTVTSASDYPAQQVRGGGAEFGARVLVCQGFNYPEGWLIFRAPLGDPQRGEERWRDEAVCPEHVTDVEQAIANALHAQQRHRQIVAALEDGDDETRIG